MAEKTKQPSATGLPDAAESTASITPAMPDGGELLVWAVACGLKPTTGWFRTIRINEPDVHQLVLRDERAFARYRLLHTIGNLLDRDHIALLLRARLAEQVLSAESVKDLVEAIRVFEKLPAGGTGARGTTSPAAEPVAEPEPDLSGLDLESAIAEARRLLTDLDGDFAQLKPGGAAAPVASDEGTGPEGDQ